jgi:hypothetical protein
MENNVIRDLVDGSELSGIFVVPNISERLLNQGFEPCVVHGGHDSEGGSGGAGEGKPAIVKSTASE